MGAKNSTQKSVEKFENIFDNKKNSKSKPEKGCNECQIKIKKEEEKKKEEDKKVIVNKRCKQCER